MRQGWGVALPVLLAGVARGLSLRKLNRHPLKHKEKEGRTQNMKPEIHSCPLPCPPPSLVQVIYIAPLKALVRERIKDWGQGFCRTLGKRMVELTGDFTPDMVRQTAVAADLLCPFVSSCMLWPIVACPGLVLSPRHH